MFYFVEYLRAKRAMRVALILLGIFLLAAIVLRIAVHGPSANDWASTIEHSPTAHVMRTQLPDGSSQIVVDDRARQTHAVIVRRGSTLHMNITEPTSTRRAEGPDIFVMGSMNVNENRRAGISHVTVEYGNSFAYDLGILFLVTIPMGLIVGTILGGPLAKENDGHLEVAWTKPVSRERYALASAAVDVAAIVLSQLLTIAVVLVATLLFMAPRFTYSEPGWFIPLAFLGPIAWYALLTAISAPLKRGPGVVCGLGWLFALIVPGIAQGLSGAAPYNAIAAWFYAIFRGLSFLDPIAYLSLGNGHSAAPLGLSVSTVVAALAALTIGYLAVSVLVWRRVEA